MTIVRSLRQTLRTTNLAFVLALLFLAGCSSSPTSPDDGNNGSGSGGSGGGTTNASMSGTINGAAYNPTIGFATNSGGIVGFGAGDTNFTFAIAFFASSTGTFSIPGSSGNAVGNNASLSATNGNQWVSGITTGGSGTVTLTSFSSTSMSGSISLTMVPVPGTGATGNKTFSANFTAHF